MTQYTVANTTILLDGLLYREGETIELDDKTAQVLAHYINSNSNAQTDKAVQAETNDVDTSTDTATAREQVDYDVYTTSELKKLVEQRNLNIVETGKNGAVKADYVKALSDADNE